MQDSVCVLLTGRDGAGKRTVGRGVVDELRRRDVSTVLVDRESVERHLADGAAGLAWLCTLLVDGGVVAVVSAPVPGRDARERLRGAVPALLEVFVDAPADVCASRGTSADAVYENPYAPDLRVPTHDRDPLASIAQVVSFLEERGFAPR